MSNELNYVDYNFDDLVTQLQNRLKESDVWKDTYQSATGQMLIELLAYVANLVLYYIERRAEESYIATAKNKSSVVNIVKLLNYSPKRPTSATGDLTFSITAAHYFKIFITQWTSCQTVNGTKYLVSAPGIIPIGATSVKVTGIQGEYVAIQRIGDGTASQVVTLDTVTVENTNFDTVGSGKGVFVDTVEWTKVDTFLSSGSASKHYRVTTETNETVSVTFGDGVFGMAPSVGSEIVVKCIKSAGLAGNVYEADKIVQINSVIYDSGGINPSTGIYQEPAAITNISVTNASDATDTDLFLGGDDAEDIEEIRDEAPRVFATGDRAVTRTDFITLIENYAGVADANVWGENEETSPDYDMFNRLKLCVLLQEWQEPSTAFKTALTDYLYALSMMTVRYSFVDAEILYVIPTLDVKVRRGSSLSETQADVEEAFEGAFTLGTTVSLGTDKRYSDMVALIDNLAKVSYCHLVMEIRKELQLAYDSFYEYGETLEAIPVLPGSVRVFVDMVQVGVDDGAGGFTSEVSGLTLSGDIDYETGVTGIDITPDLSSGEVLYVRYQQDQDGDIVVDEDQIGKLYTVDITDISIDTNS